MRKYQSHKVVEAAEIWGFNATRGAGHVMVQSDNADGFEKVQVPDGFFARGWPAHGDYLVRYEPDGYLSFSPGDKFKAGYTAVDSDTATAPPLTLLTNPELARIDREIIRIGEAAVRTRSVIHATQAAEEQYKARQRLGTLVLDIVERLCADRVAASTITHSDGTVHTAKTSLMWMKDARRSSNGESYYRNIVDKVGELLGVECKTQDDGNVVPEVLRAKVYEVAKKRLAQPAIDPVELGREVASRVTALHWGIGQSLPDTVPAAVLVRRQDQVSEVVRSCLAEMQVNPVVPTPTFDRVAVAERVATILAAQSWVYLRCDGHPVPTAARQMRVDAIVAAVLECLPDATVPVAETRFLVYGGNSYYPSGGHLDYRGSYHNVDRACNQAQQAAKDDIMPWWHVVDRSTGKVVAAHIGEGTSDIPKGIRDKNYICE